MWRFIVVSFLFLGWAFYQLSGGADYQPAEGSLQAARPVEKTDTPVEQAELVEESKSVAVVEAKTENNETKDSNAELASLLKETPASNDDTQVITAVQTVDENATNPENADSIVTEVRFNSALDAFKQQSIAISGANQGTGDYRKVTGNSVNLRSGPGKDFVAVDKLRSGRQVEVLAQEGEWLQLRVVDTGVTGWMADWLVTTANN